MSIENNNSVFHDMTIIMLGLLLEFTSTHKKTIPTPLSLRKYENNTGQLFSAK